MKNTIKKIWSGVNVALIVVVAVLAIALAGVKLVGLDVYVILSGSMEPEYQTGGIIYIKDIEDPNTLQSGDVITYNISNGATVTHRIVDVVQENGQTMYQTKGDANDNVDASLVPQNQVIGQPVFTIPYLGYLVSLIQSPSGKFALIAVAAILLLMQFLPDLIFGEDEEEDEEEEVKKPKKKRRDKKESVSKAKEAEVKVVAEEPEPKPAPQPVQTAPEMQPASKAAPVEPAQQPTSKAVPIEPAQQPTSKAVPVEPAPQPASKPASTQPASKTAPVEPAPKPEAPAVSQPKATKPEAPAVSQPKATKPEAPAAPQPQGSLQSFLDMDPDEFFNKLINDSKEEGK